MSYSPLGSICVSMGFMDEEDVDRVLHRMSLGERARFGQLALEMGLLSEKNLALALAQQYSLNLVPEDRLQALEVPEELLARIPENLMLRHMVAPLFLNSQQDVLSVLVADPTDLPGYWALQESLGSTNIRLFLGTRSAVHNFLEKLLGPQRAAWLDHRPSRSPPGERPQADWTVLLEPDSERLELMRRIEELEGARTRVVQDPEQVTHLLEQDIVTRVVYRQAVAAIAESYQDVWRRIQPELELLVCRSLGLDDRVGPQSWELARFLLNLLTFAFTASESRDLDARIRLRRAVELSRALTLRLGLSPDKAEKVVLATILVGLDGLALGRAIKRDSMDGDSVGTGRLALARSMLAAWPPPFEMNKMLDALEKRLGGGGRIGANLGAEVVYTVRAIVRRGRPGDTHPGFLLGTDLGHHDPRVVHAAADILKWEVLCPEMITPGRDEPQILLAVQQPDDLNLLEVELKAAGFRVLMASDATDVMRLIKAAQIVGVVADFRIGRLSGSDLVRAIHQHTGSAEIPVFLLMGQRSGPEAAHALDAGAEDVVQRPLNAGLLLAKIRRATDRVSRQGSRVLRGRLEDLPLPDLIQMLTLGARTASIGVASQGRSGEIYIQEGRLLSAAAGEVEGQQALAMMVSCRDGSFTVRFGNTSKEQNLQGSAEWLLLEAMRQADEASSADGQTGSDE